MDINSKSMKELFNAILALGNLDESQRFFRDLLTEKELEEFANRWKAAQMLSQRVPYSVIEQKTRLSSTTIARISKWLNKGMGGYKLIVERLKENR